MNRLQRLTQALVTSCLLMFSLISQAEQKTDFGDFEVHYNAFTSTFLSPEIAKQYGLIRSKAIGILNISLMDKRTGKAVPVAGQVEGIVSNDIQQQTHLGFKRVQETNALYYLAQFQFIEGEILTFNLTTYPEGSRQPLKMRFTQSFYND